MALKPVYKNGLPVVLNGQTVMVATEEATAKEWALLASQTLEEAAQAVSVQLSSPTKHFITQMWCPKTDAESNPMYINLSINNGGTTWGNIWAYLSAKMPSKDYVTQVTVEARSLEDGNWAISAYANFGGEYGRATSYNVVNTVPPVIQNNGENTAQTVKIGVIVNNDAAQNFPIGSVFRVWGKLEEEEST